MNGAKASVQYRFTVDDASQGQRLDVFLSTQVESISRSQVQLAINTGLATSDGQALKSSSRVRSGQEINFSPLPAPPSGPVAEDIPLDILYEDDQLVVVNKPAGMVVHPSTGHWNGTLASALVYRFQQLSDSGGAHRPGIIHRLDRDTSGCIVVARTNAAHANVSAQFVARTVEKTYLAVVTGNPDRDRDIINKPIGKHPRRREQMAIRSGHSTSRAAESFYEVIERYHKFSLLRIRPKTGRTHQIRVHLSHIGHPVACDSVYGATAILVTSDLGIGDDCAEAGVILGRQALHASSITFSHPGTGERITVEAPLAEDMARLVAILGQERP
jgi:23S rRNA pseudouridine1911/1915/1917 synthase